jgi:hypothetical protein
LWDSKGAGINTWGDLEGTAVDTNGDDQAVLFSEITSVPVSVDVILTVSSAYDSGSSNDAIAASIEAFSIAELSAGVDVLNYKVEGAATTVGAVGITQLRTEMSYGGGAYSANNIPISSDQFAFLDEDLVTFDITVV